MTDREYFQGLLATAKDFTMQSFYEAAVLSRPLQPVRPCEHPEVLPYFERSYGILFSWEACTTCGKELNPKRLDGHE